MSETPLEQKPWPRLLAALRLGATTSPLAALVSFTGWHRCRPVHLLHDLEPSGGSSSPVSQVLPARSQIDIQVRARRVSASSLLRRRGDEQRLTAVLTGQNSHSRDKKHAAGVTSGPGFLLKSHRPPLQPSAARLHRRSQCDRCSTGGMMLYCLVRLQVDHQSLQPHLSGWRSQTLSLQRLCVQRRRGPPGLGSAGRSLLCGLWCTTHRCATSSCFQGGTASLHSLTQRHLDSILM